MAILLEQQMLALLLLEKRHGSVRVQSKLGNHLITFVLFMLATVRGVSAEPVRLLVKDDAGQALSEVVVMAKGAPASVNPEPAIMDQINKAFVPHVLVIEQGRSVKFPNSDDIRHHVYSFSKTKPFEIKLYSGSQQAPIVFDQPGVVALGCNIHDWMIGYIVVSDTAAVAKTNSTGTATLEIGDKSAPLRLWHPRLLKGSQAAVDMPLPAPDKAGVTHLTLSVKPLPNVKPASGFGNRFRSNAQ